MLKGTHVFTSRWHFLIFEIAFSERQSAQIRKRKYTRHCEGKFTCTHASVRLTAAQDQGSGGLKVVHLAHQDVNVIRQHCSVTANIAGTDEQSSARIRKPSPELRNCTRTTLLGTVTNHQPSTPKRAKHCRERGRPESAPCPPRHQHHSPALQRPPQHRRHR